MLQYCCLFKVKEHKRMCTSCTYSLIVWRIKPNTLFYCSRVIIVYSWRWSLGGVFAIKSYTILNRQFIWITFKRSCSDKICWNVPPFVDNTYFIFAICLLIVSNAGFKLLFNQINFNVILWVLFAPRQTFRKNLNPILMIYCNGAAIESASWAAFIRSFLHPFIHSFS